MTSFSLLVMPLLSSILLVFFAAAAQCSPLSCCPSGLPGPFPELFLRSQPVLPSWTLLSQDLTLALVELRKVLVIPLFHPIQVFLQGGALFQSVHFSTQFHPIFQITFEDIKVHWAKYQTQGDPVWDGFPV